MTGDTGDLTARVRLTRTDGFVLDVALHAPAATTTVVLGPNGAGKSTLLAVLAGLLRPDEGSVRVGSTVWDEAATGTWVAPPDRHAGVVFQGGLLFDHLDVRGNVAFGPRAAGQDRDTAVAIANGWLERLGVAELGDRRPPALSGGQAQRVALARALATDPVVLLLDEPFSALDASGRTGLRRLLGDVLADLPGPRVLVTHDATEAFLLGDRLHVLEGGRTTQVGTPEEVRLRPATPYVADLAGVNLVAGSADRGAVTTGGHVVEVADRQISGPVLLTIRPQAIALHPTPPMGSPRNVWATRVVRVEPTGDRVRVLLGAPLPLTAEVTPGAAASLGLAPGRSVHAALKATEIVVTPDT